jgi:hypothetical protein
MSRSSLTAAQWRQIGFLTLGAAAVLAALRALPAGPKLTHLDFVAGGPGALEFCDPSNPRFLPVVARSSPVTVALATAAPVERDTTGDVRLTLRTVTGKPIGPDDLRPNAGMKLEVLAVDPALEDFVAAAPAPTGQPGEWRFAFTPRREGVYRIFADFTPAATGLEMYASADLAATLPGAERVDPNALIRPPTPAGALGWSPRQGFGPQATGSAGTAERDGLRLALAPSASPVRAREPIDLVLTVERLDGSDVSLEPVDGAWASLVAIDQKRTGFVNLRADSPSAQGRAIRLVAGVTIADPGRYVIWSRVRSGGREVTAPFALEVIP